MKEFRVEDRGQIKLAKNCLKCGKIMTWRKKWESIWDSIQYCSDKCKADAKLEPELLDGHQVKLVKIKGGLERIKFVVPEDDLHESFVKGFGPGG